MKHYLLIIAFGLAAGLGGVVAYQAGWGTGSRPAGTGAGSSSATLTSNTTSGIVALGRLEPAGGILDVGSPLVGTQIGAIRVKEGDRISAGDVLMELGIDALQTELELAQSRLDEAVTRTAAEKKVAQARLDSAQLALTQAQDGARFNRDHHERKSRLLESQLEQARRDLERLTKLRARNDPLASAQQVEHQRLLAEKAAAELETARSGTQELEQAADSKRQLAEAELNAAQANWEAVAAGGAGQALAKQVQLAELRREHGTLKSPGSGVVISVLSQVGELVTQTPLLQIADLNQVVCIAEIDEKDIQHLRRQQTAQIHSRAFKGPFDSTYLTGRIERFGRVMAAPKLQPIDPFKPVDRHIIEVVLSLDAQRAARLVNDELSALINLQVEVRIASSETSTSKP